MDVKQQMALGETALIYLMRDNHNRTHSKSPNVYFSLSSLYQIFQLDADLTNPCLDSLKEMGYIVSYRWLIPEEPRIVPPLYDIEVTLPSRFLEMCRQMDQRLSEAQKLRLSNEAKKKEAVDNKRIAIDFCKDHGFHIRGCLQPNYCPKMDLQPSRILNFLIGTRGKSAKEIISETEYNGDVQDLSKTIQKINSAFLRALRSTCAYPIILHSDSSGYYLNIKDYEIADARGIGGC